MNDNIENTVQNDEEDTVHLAKLSDFDYEMEEGQPDITGWKVLGWPKHDEIGKITNLLVDLDTGAIVLAIVDLGERSTLVPIEVFEIDMPNKAMILAVDTPSLEQAPDFTEENPKVSEFFDFWAGDPEIEEEEGNAKDQG